MTSEAAHELTTTKQSVDLSKLWSKEFFSVGSRKITSDLSNSASCCSFKDYTTPAVVKQGARRNTQAYAPSDRLVNRASSVPQRTITCQYTNEKVVRMSLKDLDGGTPARSKERAAKISVISKNCINFKPKPSQPGSDLRRQKSEITIFKNDV